MFEQTFPKIETDRNEPSLLRTSFEGFSRTFRSNVSKTIINSLKHATATSSELKVSNFLFLDLASNRKILRDEPPFRTET
ncbi:MAG: hypothetical protein ACTS6A_01525 [Candidatus Hodgkinia cicadicola]